MFYLGQVFQKARTYFETNGLKGLKNQNKKKTLTGKLFNSALQNNSF